MKKHFFRINQKDSFLLKSLFTACSILNQAVFMPMLFLAFSLIPKDAAAATVSISCSPTSITVTGTCNLTITSGATASTSTPTICSVSGTTVTGLAAGSCSVTGAKSGSTSKTISITVSKKAQTISTPTFSPTPVYVSVATTVSATATSGLPVTFTTTTPSICTVSGTIVTPIAAGTCTIKSDQAGNTTWAAATQLSTNVTIAKKSQTITFATPAFNPATLLALDTTTVSATASSGLAVVFTTATASVCTVSGSTVAALISGTCTVNANVAATAVYDAAPQVQKSITVGKRNQTITGVFNPTTLNVGGSPTTLTLTSVDAITLSATTLIVTPTNQTTTICTMAGGTAANPRSVTITPSTTNKGTCTIRATQTGTTVYNAATTVDFSIAVTGKLQTIGPVSFTINPVYLGGTSVVSATASSGLIVTFSSLTPAICSVGASTGTATSTATVTASSTTGGICTIAANQSGNTTWAAASQMTGDLTVTNGRFTLSVAADPPDPTTVYATQGINASATITVTFTPGLLASEIADVALSVFSGLPANTSAFFTPPIIPAGSNTAQITFAANMSSTTGIYTITIRGSSRGLNQDQTIILKIISSYGGWMDFFYIYSVNNGNTPKDDLTTNDCVGTDYSAASRCTKLLPYDVDWRMISADVNVMYYNPAVTYLPWPGFPQASFTAARSNPQSGSIGYPITTDLSGIPYEVAIDDSGFDTPVTGMLANRPHRGTKTNKSAGANGWIDLWDSHTRYTVDANSVTKKTYVYDHIITTGVDVGLNPTTTTTTLSDSTTCYPDLGGGGLPCRSIAETQQNVANWYQYYRRRSLTTKAAVGNVVTNTPNYRYGLSLINDSATVFVQMPLASTIDYTTHNSTLLDKLYKYPWKSFGTPLQAGLDRTGQYYKNLISGKPSPIISQCQQNFTILMTDGYWNGTVPSGIGNQDGDLYSDTLADVAYKYYKDDLSPAFLDVVPTSFFDTATWQHMVTFSVALGVTGALSDMDGDGWPNPPLTESENWGNPNSCSDCPPKIDDMWHAAYNSRGTFVSAKSPQDLQQAMTNALANISVRVGTAASIATNSTSLNTDTLIYQAKFDPTDWSGEIVAYRVNSDGSVDDTNSYWDTENIPLPNPTDRHIYTWNGSTGLNFNVANWNSLSATQKTALQNGSTVTAGQDRINWLLGDQAREQPVGTLRKRTHLLGDIVNSNPTYASGDIDFDYALSTSTVTGKESYADFVATNATSPIMLYVGANDGILHAFNASTGTEQFGYIPNAIFPNLQTGAPSLTSPGYGHRYFVDGSPQIGHAYWNGAWHTVLVSSNGAGAKSIFALDVTHPDSFAANKVLWEFSDTDLGYPINQFIQPVIAYLNGNYVVIFGNGYESTNKRAVLFIVNVATGALIRKIDTGVGSAGSPNGMAGPVLTTLKANVDGTTDDDNRVLKYAYAGDLQGNLWKFDLTNLSSAFTADGSTTGTPKPLFQARSSGGVVQPITAPPDISLHSNYGYILVFGTGKFFETDDHTNIAQQTLYGIWDKNDDTIECNSNDDACVYPTNRSTLQQQSIINETSTNGNNWRELTANALDWDTKRGWYLDLLTPPLPPGTAKGERIVSAPILALDPKTQKIRVIVVTLIPAVQSCFGGGTSWIMQIDLDTGGSLGYPTFDVNGDGVIDASDGDVSSIESTVGIINSPVIVSNDDSSYILGAGSTSRVMSAKIPTLNVLVSGQDPNKGKKRTSWNQIR